MLKKSVQQGRRRVEPGGGTDRTSWSRSPIQWILANGKTPPAIPPSENLNRYVEDFDESRTKLADFFSFLLLIRFRFEFPLLYQAGEVRALEFEAIRRLCLIALRVLDGLLDDVAAMCFHRFMVRE
jgi:hypothetical protein